MRKRGDIFGRMRGNKDWSFGRKTISFRVNYGWLLDSLETVKIG